MAGQREIRNRLESVKNTKKITYAMKLVSAAKLRRAQEAVQRGRVYTTELNQLVSSLSSELQGLDNKPAMMEMRAKVTRALVVVIGGSRGLCGGYNTNLNKKVDATFKEISSRGAEPQALILGKKPAENFRRINRPYLQSFEELQEDAGRWPIEEAASIIEREFLSGNVDEVYLVYTKFKSAISMMPTTTKLLPMEPLATAAANAESKTAGITLFEPSAQQVFEALLPRLLRSQLRQAAFDSKASETGARMTAMDAATKNAGDMINKLTLLGNKLRQSAITSQLLDIVGGAEAVK